MNASANVIQRPAANASAKAAGSSAACNVASAALTNGNITSDSLLFTGAGATAYKASKAGVIGFTRGLAADLGEYGITVNAVGPAHTRTPGILESGGVAGLEMSAQRRIIKRIAEPDDVVGTVLFLTSDDSYFVTGQTIMADGATLIAASCDWDGTWACLLRFNPF